MSDPLAAVSVRARDVRLAPLWDALAGRLGASDGPVRTVRLLNLSLEQREALSDLLGRDRLLPATTTIRVADVAAALRLDESSVRPLVERLRGPVGNRAAARVRDRADRDALWAEVASAVDGRGLDGWVARLRAAGIPEGDVAAHRNRLHPVLRLIERLPLSSPLPLPVVAAQIVGDPHWLDWGERGGWAGRVAADAAASLAGMEPPSSAEAVRSAWQAVGVVPDRLSPSVLTVGLTCQSPSVLARSLEPLAAVGEPAVLTGQQLRRWPIRCAHRVAWVVENPAVVQWLADRLEGGDVRLNGPVVCTSSWPADAAVLLLDQLRAGGTALRYHSDFDPTGLLLTEHMRQRYGAEPWRMGARDYLAAVDALPTSDEPVTFVEAAVPPTPWDPALAEVMRVRRIPVYEEQILEDMAQDVLREGVTRPGRFEGDRFPPRGRNTRPEPDSV